MSKDNMFRVMIFKDGKQHTEEYQAIIGIKVDGNNVTLHIRENGDLTNDFWRKLPDAMKANIEKGLNIRNKES